MENEQFVSTVWNYYRQHGRDLPWRYPTADCQFNAYHILVSEIMLQQTQVSRVIPKYEAFLTAFPDVRSLATARLDKVLVAWSGLGYNRRAKYLWQTAKQLVRVEQPWTYEQLLACPGIGPNTAAAVLVYAYNQPQPFIETNIRTAYIHHYFPDTKDVPDAAILALVKQTFDPDRPREFFWALMDYGSYLKSTIGNRSRQSKHYAKQSTFTGSKRQIRGRILRLLTEKWRSNTELEEMLADERASAVLEELLTEQLIKLRQGKYHLGN